MTRPGPLGRRRAPSSSSTSSSSTMASGGIRRSGISAPGPSSDGWITKHRQLNPGVYEIGASPDRREFLCGAALAGTAGLVGLRSDRALAEPPPETKRIRLLNRPTLCEAPQYVAEELLQREGFRDILYIKKGIGREEDALASGEADITMLFGPPM